MMNKRMMIMILLLNGKSNESFDTIGKISPTLSRIARSLIAKKKLRKKLKLVKKQTRSLLDKLLQRPDPYKNAVRILQIMICFPTILS